jgi:hypothetical protein
MAARPQLPGMRWFLWVRSDRLRVGILTWLYVFFAYAAWQIISYGIPQLERIAEVRDYTAIGVIIALLATPIFCFYNEPSKLFVSGLTAWTLLTLTYFTAERLFSLLETQMRAIQIFMLGAVSYGLVAVFNWVLLMCLEARHRHVAQSGHAPSHAGRPRSR